MREIKFRGMLLGGGWVYGGYVKLESGARCILSGGYDNYNIDGGVKNILKFNAVKYKTIGQYTGLKDKNGVEIYEGDIVRKEWIEFTNKEHKEQIVEVVWLGNGYGAIFWQPEELEVIGNIHSNPELLEEK